MVLTFTAMIQSHTNASSAFEKLKSCFHDVKEWMSTSNLKLNPDKTGFILFRSKDMDRLKACFPFDIFGSALCPAESLKNLDLGLMLIFPSLNYPFLDSSALEDLYQFSLYKSYYYYYYDYYYKHVQSFCNVAFCNSGTSDRSVGFGNSLV